MIDVVTPESVDAQIKKLRAQQAMCVGQLYPRIIQAQINGLEDLKEQLKTQLWEDLAGG